MTNMLGMKDLAFAHQVRLSFLLVPILAFPAINAGLNALSAALLTGGFLFIKRKNIPLHRVCMLSAFGVSVLFLASYLYYHFHAGIVHYKGEGVVRMIYFSILTTHTILAAAVPVLAIMTLSYALRGIFIKHRRIAVFTLPIWLYVSVTGVVVYLMLFH